MVLLTKPAAISFVLLLSGESFFTFFCHKLICIISLAILLSEQIVFLAKTPRLCVFRWLFSVAHR